MPPRRGRTRRGLMADDDEATTPSGSALRSTWVEDPPFPPLPSAAANESAAEVVVEAVAVVPAEGPAEAAAQVRAMHVRRATPNEHLLMLRRFDDENPTEESRHHVILTCIGAVYPAAVAGDARYKSAQKWFTTLELMKPGDDTSGGILSNAMKRAAALSRLEAESAHAQQKLKEALEKKLACDERARRVATKAAEAAARRAAQTAELHARRSQEDARRIRALNSHAAAAADPQEMPRAKGRGGKASAEGDDEEDGPHEQEPLAPPRPKPRVKQVLYHMEIMGGPAGRNETEAGDLTSMTRSRKRDLCWRGLRVLQEWAQSILNDWVDGGRDATAPPQVITV